MRTPDELATLTVMIMEALGEKLTQAEMGVVACGTLVLLAKSQGMDDGLPVHELGEAFGRQLLEAAYAH